MSCPSVRPNSARPRYDERAARSHAPAESRFGAPGVSYFVSLYRLFFAQYLYLSLESVSMVLWFARPEDSMPAAPLPIATLGPQPFSPSPEPLCLRAV